MTRKMKALLFDAFKRMIDKVPAKVIRKAIKTEHLLLEDDLLYKRIPETREVDSILSFCPFIKAAAENDIISPMLLPARHFACYRKIVKRLIRANELSAKAMEQFELTFSSGSAKRVANGAR
jgi:hypothetical protein